ncbi:MAG: hypothetical protein OEY52_15400 [Gammaproteobacteria bacterium]|nr:hypothetical protein [Gammaproteobacteria bacterium]
MHIGVHAAQQAKCEVCGNKVSRTTVLLNGKGEMLTCQSIDCQAVLKQKQSVSPVLFQSWFQFQKKLIRNRRQQERDKKAYIEDTLRQEDKQNKNILNEVLLAFPEIEPNKVDTLSIPLGKSRQSEIPQQRIDKYIAHLSKTLDEATQYQCADEVVYDAHHAAYSKLIQIEKAFNEKPQLKLICDTVCGICKGGCCVTGHNHAYLSVFFLRQYLDRHPEMTSSDVLDKYISNIAPESVEGSCINQTLTGCSLPREMRSNICNGFYCETLKSWKKKVINQDKTGELLLVQRAYDNWNRFHENVSNEVVNVALIDENGQKLV